MHPTPLWRGGGGRRTRNMNLEMQPTLPARRRQDKREPASSPAAERCLLPRGTGRNAHHGGGAKMTEATEWQIVNSWNCAAHPPGADAGGIIPTDTV